MSLIRRSVIRLWYLACSVSMRVFFDPDKILSQIGTLLYKICPGLIPGVILLRRHELIGILRE